MTPREHLQLATFRVARVLLAVRRPSAGANATSLRKRGETIATLRIREALESDIPALATLDVQTWNNTS
jgi:hypothetical protein